VVTNRLLLERLGPAMFNEEVSYCSLGEGFIPALACTPRAAGEKANWSSGGLTSSQKTSVMT
jgi:hypothetical protein